MKDWCTTMSDLGNGSATERDAGGMVWEVDESDTAECVDCGGEAVQIAELDADRYLCHDCGLVWNPEKSSALEGSA